MFYEHHIVVISKALAKQQMCRADKTNFDETKLFHFLFISSLFLSEKFTKIVHKNQSKTTKAAFLWR